MVVIKDYRWRKRSSPEWWSLKTIGGGGGVHPEWWSLKTIGGGGGVHPEWWSLKTIDGERGVHLNGGH